MSDERPQLLLNGIPHPLPDNGDLASLLAELGLVLSAFAVAVNGSVVPRAEHASTALRPGDRVEVIRAVGGG